MKQFLIMSLLVLTSYAQAQDNDGESRKLIETFFTTYEKSNVEKALDELFSTNVYFSMVPSHNIDEMKKKLVTLIESIGEYCGYEIIAKKTIGKSMIHYSCIVNYERQPLRYTFILYKPKDSWVLYNFQFDAEIMNELNESAKFYDVK